MPSWILTSSGPVLADPAQHAGSPPISAQPPAGLARVAITRAMLCGPDAALIKAVHAGRTQFAGVLGHSAVGIVEAIEAQASVATGLRAGTRVALGCVLACAACDRCRSGLSSHCAQRRVLGLDGHDGVLRARATLPAWSLAELPASVSDDQGVFANAVAGAVHAARLVRVESKPYVTVLGDGMMGLLVAQVLARCNASVRVLGKHPERMRLCERWSIKHRDVHEVGLRADQDVIVDCTGRAGGLELAQRLVRPRGTIVIKSPPASPLRDWKPGPDLSFASAAEVQVLWAGPGSVHDGVTAIARRQVDVEPLASRTLPFSRAGQGLTLLARGAEEGLLGVVVVSAEAASQAA